MFLNDGFNVHEIERMNGTFITLCGIYPLNDWFEMGIQQLVRGAAPFCFTCDQRINERNAL